MEVTQSEFTIVQVLAEFGFAITAVIGLAYFIYYIWNFICLVIKNFSNGLYTFSLYLFTYWNSSFWQPKISNESNVKRHTCDKI